MASVRALHIVGNFPIPPHGGVETTAYYLGRELARLGVDVRVVSPSSTPQSVIVDGCEFMGLEAGQVSNWIQIPSLRSLRRLRELIRQADVVHILNPQEVFNLIAIGLTIQARRPLVLSIPVSNSLRSHPRTLFRWAGTLDDRLIRYAIGRAAIAHVKNPVDFDYVRRISSRARYIPDAAPDFLFSAPPSGPAYRLKLGLERASPILLFLGRLHPLKGPDHLIRAVKSISTRLPSVAAVIAGPDFEGESHRLAMLSRKLGIEERVRIVGPIDEREKVDLLDLADVLVVPSLSDFVEGFSIVASESWARHKPVVGYPVGALKVRIRNGENGYLAEGVDPEALAAAVEKAIRLDRVLVPSDVISWSRVAEQFREVYRSVSDTSV
jgi:glycosyltransferase involved in cell wall biosynthesis